MEMVKSNGSAKKRGRPYGSKNKKLGSNHPHGGGRRRRKNNAHGCRKYRMICLPQRNRRLDIMSSKHYSIYRDAGQHLTLKHRQILQTAWNQYINKCARITIRHFARLHNIPYETWRRELKRGATGPIIRQGNRWIYPEYDAEQATASINEGKSNMGTKMKLTKGMADMFRYFVITLRKSPYDARMCIIEAYKDAKVPCLKTFYNHIEAGDMGVYHGDTPYHPGKRKRAKIPAHEAKVVPGRRQLKDRPQAAAERSELGHYEMDTVVSRQGCKGGLLVLLDRCSRRYIIEHINFVNQDEIIKGIKRMKARGALRGVRSVTTDNGCEFLNQEKLDRVFKSEVYYTRAYASYEKGSIENCNRLVRRWFPKGTDFNQVSRRAIQQLEDTINNIHRESLGGETSYAYDTRLAQAA